MKMWPGRCFPFAGDEALDYLEETARQLPDVFQKIAGLLRASQVAAAGLDPVRARSLLEDNRFEDPFLLSPDTLPLVEAEVLLAEGRTAGARARAEVARRLLPEERMLGLALFDADNIDRILASCAARSATGRPGSSAAEDPPRRA